MLTIETGDLRTMNLGRKGALLMLAVVVFWTAAPVCACLLTTQPSGQHSCCRSMERKCGMPGMSMNGSCCRVQQQNTAVTPVPPYSPEHSQKLGFVPHQASLQLSVALVFGFQDALEEPPPKFPPGCSSILRI
jgi:hypothetical protein